ncbi:MAG TPA: VOC family protein [Longimicrobium sp.]|nr:VOC family protein [Longimicrobium sp.]
MKRLLIPVLLLAAGVAAGRAYTPAPEAPMKKLTPVLVVDSIVPAERFWTERLGFEKTVEVPHGDEPGFIILVRDGVEIMYQTRASVGADMPALAEGPYRTVLFIEVEDIDAVERAVQGVEIVQPRRTTFYGMHEITVREPGGSVVVFAQPTGEGG